MKPSSETQGSVWWSQYKPAVDQHIWTNRALQRRHLYSPSSIQEAVSLPDRTGATARSRSSETCQSGGKHPLGDYPTTESNELESRTTKSEFFWVYFGVFLALGFGGVAARPKTLIINFIAKTTLRSAAAQRVPLNPSGLIER